MFYFNDKLVPVYEYKLNNIITENENKFLQI